MIEMKNSLLSVTCQAKLFGVSRTSAYRRKARVSENDINIQIMHLIDKIHTNYPTYGYRIVTRLLVNMGFKVNRKRVRRLMRKMGIYAIYPGPNLSKLWQAKYRMPYLLRGLKIKSSDHVWGIDITYLRMEKGFMYMFAIIDWYSRSVVDYELSTSLEKTFVMNCLKRALKRKQPVIINSDQGSHFTNPEYIALLKSYGVKISMDGRGRATDNARTERFFRTMKYDCIYINEFDSPKAMRKAIKQYVEVYNNERPCQAINYNFPATVYAQNQLNEAA